MQENAAHFAPVHIAHGKVVFALNARGEIQQEKTQTTIVDFRSMQNCKHIAMALLHILYG